MEKLKWYEWVMLIVLVGMLVLGAALSPWGVSFFNSDGAPAWVQAVGALVALGIAIWVPARQHQREVTRARTQEAKEVRRTLTSIRDELEIRYEQYQRLIQCEIVAAKGAGELNCYWLLPENSFPVYHSVLPKISAIESESLRKSIIRCYALMEGLLRTVDANSELARNYMAAQDAMSINPCADTELASALARVALKEYFPRVIEADEHAVACIKILLGMLSKDVSPEEPQISEVDSVSKTGYHYQENKGEQ